MPGTVHVSGGFSHQRSVLSILITPIARSLQDLGVFTWDFGLTLINLMTPSRKAGHVVPEGHPVAGGKWPEYIPPL